MATNATPEFLYMLDEDLYRLANASSPKLDHARPVKDIQTYDRNGIVMVRANGLGVSLLTLERIERERSEHKGSYLWKLLAETSGELSDSPPRPCACCRHPQTSPRPNTRPLFFMPTI